MHKKLFILLFLIFVSSVQAHEGHNEILARDGNWWTWENSINSGDKFRWKFEVWDDGQILREGKVNIEVLKDLHTINLLDYFKIQNTTDLTFDEYTNQFFKMEYDEDILLYKDVYPAKYYIAPIYFYMENGTSYNLLNSSYSEVYVGLINETINLICTQGCHYEDTSPFNITSSRSYHEDNHLVTKGEFKVNDFVGSDYYGYSKGTFLAKYDISTGVLQYWGWESEDKLEKLTITIEDLKFEQALILTAIGSGIMVFIYILYKVIVPKLFFPSDLSKRIK